ncbi:uncharacterized protein LOC134277024 [Saccostrea cucullata]|uniref:uncharacterized protein LOC134277024 n=1 Tax=Saccostrea cuccullata TaxID=36930 RepID=UPI002ED0FC50
MLSTCIRMPVPFMGLRGGIETSMPGCSAISSMAVSPTQTVTNRITKDNDVDIWQDACEDLPVPSPSPASCAFIALETCAPLEEPLSPPSPPRQLCASSFPVSTCSRDPNQGKEREKRKSVKRSVEDVYRLQCEVLEEEKEKIKKEKEKLDLQIQLLHAILKRQDDEQTELLASLM